MSEPARVTIRYILVGFRPPGFTDESRPRRTRDEAEARARTVFDRARSGEDFGSLVREFSDARRAPLVARRRIEELYCKAMKADSLDQIRPEPESSVASELYRLERHLQHLSEYGSDFDTIRAGLEKRKAGIPYSEEVKARLDQKMPGFRDWVDAPYPESLTEIVWLTRDRAVFDDLLRRFTLQEIDDTFTLADEGAAAAPGQIPRSQTMKPWADVAFRLEPGEVGFVVPDATCSPDFAVVKRVE